ncbi:hypothetical protein [Ensifer aridi]|uniref:hypothetical protein n=1 Tax=Ensifer aridi TaxID=1708715 RepID=UPI00358F3ABD
MANIGKDPRGEGPGTIQDRARMSGGTLTLVANGEVFTSTTGTPTTNTATITVSNGQITAIALS